MTKIMERSAGIALAALLAGPFFVFMVALASLYDQLPGPIVIHPDSVIMLIGFACFAVVGTIIALPINALGTVMMLALGEWLPPARTPVAWAIGGVLLGGLGVWLIEASAGIAFALVATSAFCGWLCSWDGRRAGDV